MPHPASKSASYSYVIGARNRGTDRVGTVAGNPKLPAPDEVANSQARRAHGLG